jgi:GNAT superfamily N-acetyltransferase
VRILVAESAERLLGYLAFGGSRDPGAPAEVGEIWTLFVAPLSWRQGVGSALISRALEHLAADGLAEATVWSFADNARASAFYERHGFAPDGAERREEFWANVLELRYRRSLK